MSNQREIVHVAYVEDEPSIAQLLVSGLGLFGIKVRPIYMSGEELLDHIDDEAFEQVSIFFFDIRLPQMSGVDLAAPVARAGRETAVCAGKCLA
jgi:FixJ family two-component response regulator